MILNLFTHFCRLYRHIKGFRNHLFLLALLQVGVAFFDLFGMTFLYLSLITFFTGKLPENIPASLTRLFQVTGLDNQTKDSIILLTFFILIIRVVMGMIHAYYTAWLGRSVHLFFTTRINEKILLSSYRDMVARSSGELAVALGDESYTLGQTMIDLSEVISTSMVISLYFVVIGYLSLRYGLFLFGSLFVMGFVTFLTILIGKKFGDKLFAQSKKLYSVMFDLINNMKAIRLFNNEEEEIKKFEQMFSKYRSLHVLKDLFSGLTSAVPLLVLYILVLIIYLVYFFKSENSVSYNSSLAVLLFGYTTRVLFGCKILVSRLGIAVSNAQAGKDVFDILELPNDGLEKRTDVNLDFSGEVRFEKINFAHRGQTLPLFVDLNLNIPFGKHVAIVGETGSGKTTLLDLYVGLLRPLSGRVLVSDQDLNQSNLRFWRSKVIYVNQEISLFNDTVYNNLTYGASEKDMDKVIRFSKLALCHDFITALPEGYSTVLHYQAKNLSGGQKQRLLIAHALICEPEVLILDESTSSLDDYTQGIIMQNIKNLYQNKTLIVVTHKSEMRSLFDHIIRLDKGTVVYEGHPKGYREIYYPKVSS